MTIGCRSRYGDNNVDLAPHQVGGKRSGKVAALLGGLVLDVDITTIDITKLAQSLLEGLDRIRRSGRWKKVQDADARDFPRLLRVRD